MSEKPEDDLLSQDHLSRFGSIVYSFAHLEYLMQSVMAGVAGLDPDKITILTKALTYSQKRDTLYSYLKFYNLPAAKEAQIKVFLIAPINTMPCVIISRIHYGPKEPGQRP
jgi:hypothetical protein